MKELLRPKAAVLLGIGLVASLLFFWNIGTTPLENWDEGIYAEVSREMIASGNVLDLSYRDRYFAEKPPLAIWLSAAFFPVFGPSELSVRLPSALAGIATAMLLGLWAWQSGATSGTSRSAPSSDEQSEGMLHASTDETFSPDGKTAKWRAWFAALVGAFFLATHANFFHGFRTGETDGLLTLSFVVAFWAYSRTERLPRTWLLVGCAVGAAFLLKPLVGIIPLAIIGLDIFVGNRWKSLRWKELLGGLIMMLAIALPWHLYQLASHGATFWNDFFGFHVVQRTEQVLYAHYVPWHWYAAVIDQRMFPFVPFVVLSVLLALWRAIARRNALDRLLLLWATVIFVTFAIVKTKFDWYVLPLYPALALIAGRGVAFALVQGARLFRALSLLAFGIMVWSLPRFIPETRTLWKATPHSLLDAHIHDATLRTAVATLLAVIGTLLLFRIVRRFRSRTALPLTVLVALGYAFFLAFGWEYAYFHGRPVVAPLKEIAAYSEQNGMNAIDAVDADLDHQTAGYFYLRRIPGATILELNDENEGEAPYVLVQNFDAAGNAPERALFTSGNYSLLRRRAAK